MPRTPVALPVALALIVGALACGKSRQEEVYERRRDTCLGFVANGLTVREAEEALSGPTTVVRCLPGEDSGAEGPKLARYPGDECDHTGYLCDLGWCYLDNDPGLCGDFGCWYSCGARVIPRDDGTGRLVVTEDTPVCGSRWASGQPGPSFCGAF